VGTIPLSNSTTHYSATATDPYLNVSANICIVGLTGNTSPGSQSHDGVFLGFGTGGGNLVPGDSQFYGVIFGPTGNISVQEGASCRIWT
jgi:hypothetical protein